MNKRRVVITGMGQVSPIGNTVDMAWSSILEGKSGISTITKADVSKSPCKIAGEVKDFDISKYISIKEARRSGAYTHYGVAAAYQAIEDAGLDDIPNLDKTRVGVNISSGIGGVGELDRGIKAYTKYGAKRLTPFFIPSTLINMVSGMVSIYKGYQGPSYAIVSACTSSGHSIGNAMRLIQYGDADIMITGGAEAAIAEPGILGFCAARALSLRNDDPITASRPWDRDRDGFIMGEGAGVLVLEEYELAKKRGAKIYAELAGFGMSSDAYHITAPVPDGSSAALGIKNALKDAQLNADQVDYINAHGTSTISGDVAETKAVKIAFKDHAYNLVMSSTKSMTGHLLGAAGGVEAIYSVLALNNGVAPPTINIFNQDIESGCDLDYCKNEARDLNIDVAISNSFGFGGTNATIVLRKI